MPIRDASRQILFPCLYAKLNNRLIRMLSYINQTDIRV